MKTDIAKDEEIDENKRERDESHEIEKHNKPDEGEIKEKETYLEVVGQSVQRYNDVYKLQQAVSEVDKEKEREAEVVSGGMRVEVSPITPNAKIG